MRAEGEGWVRAVSWVELVGIESEEGGGAKYVTYDSETAGIGDGGSQLCVADPLHSTLHDGDC